MEENRTGKNETMKDTAANRAIGRIMYAYGMLWLWPFRWCPAGWVVNGCNGWTTLRGKIGAFITDQFAWVRNQRYETLVLGKNKSAKKHAQDSAHGVTARNTAQGKDCTVKRATSDCGRN